MQLEEIPYLVLAGPTLVAPSTKTLSPSRSGNGSREGATDASSLGPDTREAQHQACLCI